MKKYLYLLMAWTLIVLPFASCDDDDDENLVVPNEVVTNLSFTDTDIDPEKIGGSLTWELPASEDNITGYIIYQGESSTDKKTKLGEVAAGTSSFLVESGTNASAYLLVTAKNAVGESDKSASIAVKDNSGYPVVTNLAFTDTDPNLRLIGGTLTWTLPESEELISGYAIYLSDESTKKGEKIDQVAEGVSSYDIPAGTPYKPYLQVIAIVQSGESENISSLAIKDEVADYDGRLYILHAGNWNANNASLSFYDFKTETMTTDVYKNANGSGLGDSAEQILIYGSKMYVTVTTSNRLVVLDLDGKLIKSFEPVTANNEPVNPRCMVAENGKVYVSYFYAHSVAVLDTASLEIGGEVKVGRYPEQLTVANGKIYVANSGGNDYPNYGNTVSVINPSTMTVEKEIEVIDNPVGIASDSEGDVYVISWADHGKTTNQSLQKIDRSTGEVTVIGSATRMSIVNDKIYTVWSQYYNSPGTSYQIFDALTDKVISNNFITDGTTISSPNAIAVDPLTEKIYISYFDYVSTSSVYMFSADGKLEKTVDTGGYDAKYMTFYVNK